MEKRYYLAYGSNLNVEQMMFRCPKARVIGTAVINDYRLLVKGSQSGSYLTIEPMEGSSVPVAVWAVTQNDERSLDRYEGYPTFYYKKELKVEVKGIRTGKISSRNAFVYIMHDDRPLGIPAEYYLMTCLQGYDSFGFDRNILAKAFYYSKEALKK